MKPSGDWRFLPGIPVEGPSLSLSAAEIAQFEEMDDQSETYDLIAIPDGWGTISSTFWHKTYRMNKPGGVLYAGFAGHGRILLKRRRPSELTANPFHISQQLQQAGYQNLTLYGALPNHLNPVYLFPLQAVTIRFVLTRYLHKIRSAHGRAWLAYLISRWGMSLLPAYAVVAMKKDV